MKKSTAVGFAAVGLALLGLLALVGGGVGYWYYTRTPTYAVHQVRKAVRAHDVPLFETYVDARGVCESIVDQALQAQEATRPKDGWERMGRAIGEGMMLLLKPKLVDELRREMLEAVATGELGNPTGRRGEGIALDDVLERAGASRRGFEGIDYVRKGGERALVGIRVRREDDSRFVLEMNMRWAGDHWQVMALTNLAKLMQEERTRRR